MALYQLPISGDFIDPETVREITVLPKSRHFSVAHPAATYPPRVVLVTAGGGSRVLVCDGDAHAIEIRDEIAQGCGAAPRERGFGARKGDGGTGP